MDQITLAFQERTELKKTASHKLRVAGKIPAVVYGQGTAAHVSVDSREFLKKFSSFGENTVIKLQNGKTVYDVLVKDFQDEILTGQIKHIDFYQVSTTKTLHAKIPLHLTGSAVGIRNGGLLEQLLHEVEVECLAKDLPHSIDIDVANLDLGASVHVSDLKVAAGVKILNNAHAVVAHIISTRGLDVPETVVAAPAAEAAPAAAAAAPAKAQEKKA